MTEQKYSARLENLKKGGRGRNKDVRSREYFTYPEIETLIDAAGRRGRTPVRDQLLLTMMFRHGLRAQEAGRLRWEAVMLDQKKVQINRLKKSDLGVHPLGEDELYSLHILKDDATTPYVFVGERGSPLSTPAIARILAKAAEEAGITIKVHPHMLRHACGFYLANNLKLDTRLIQDWMGHKNIQHTVRYTKLNPDRFKEITW